MVEHLFDADADADAQVKLDVAYLVTNQAMVDRRAHSAIEGSERADVLLTLGTQASSS